MTTPNPHATGETIEQLLERIIFKDPATHPLRAEWEQTRRTEQEVFDRVCREEYETRLEYHRICQRPDPEATARHEANLCQILFKEELDARLMERWTDIQSRVRAVLADKGTESAESPDGSPVGGAGSAM